MLYTVGMGTEITTTEAAKLLGVSDQRVRVLIKEGRLAARMVLRGLWAVDLDSVREFERKKGGRPRKGI